MLSKQDVVDGYRWLLDRVPDANEIAAQLRDHNDLGTFKRGLFRSEEFWSRYRSASATAPTWAFIETSFGFGLWLDLFDRHVTLGAMSAAGWEPENTAFLLSHLKAGDVFWDIGANVGWFSLAAARKVSWRGRVHAFEPHPEFAKRIGSAARFNGMRNVVVHNYALGSTNGTDRLFLREGTGNAGAWSVGGAPDQQPAFTIDTRRLDDVKLWRTPSIIKMDVEGAEGLVLEGAERVVARRRPIIICEVFPTELERISGYTPQRLFRKMHEMGLKAHKLRGGNVHPMDVEEIMTDDARPCDIIFLPS